MTVKRILIAAAAAWCLGSAVPGVAGSLSQQKCMTMVKELERISNVTPHEVEAKAPPILDSLSRGERLTGYFIAYNIYVESLFNQGSVDKAREALNTMMAEASGQDDVECRVIALRTQGQFYYKLGLYDRAAERFREAMTICPPYNSELLASSFTWSSTLFWLVQADLHIGRLDEASQWIGRMDPMMAWLEATGHTDSIGYKPVMILGLKAKIALARGDAELARSLLEECGPYIKPGVPARAYVEYYSGTSQLDILQGRHTQALPILDQLIAIHIDDYKPIAAGFLAQKANSLYALGRYQESAATFREYEELKAHTDEIAIAQQLDELQTLYDVEHLQHLQDSMRKNLMLAILVCLALVCIVIITALAHKRVRAKNRVLADTISELSRLGRAKEQQARAVTAAPEAAPGAPGGNDAVSPAPGADAPSPELLAVGRRIVDYITTTQCYLKADCGRETIKEGIGVSEQQLSKALPLATGMTFVNYINRLRLDHAVVLLDSHPAMTIGEISEACGFGTMRQFQRIFKQQFDLTPSAYREARGSRQR